MNRIACFRKDEILFYHDVVQVWETHVLQLLETDVLVNHYSDCTNTI